MSPARYAMRYESKFTTGLSDDELDKLLHEPRVHPHGTWPGNICVGLAEMIVREIQPVMINASQVRRPTFVEIGRCRGISTEVFARFLPRWVRFISVDIEPPQAEALERLKDLNVEIVTASSVDFAATFADASIDGFYADGGHEEPEVHADLDAWVKKVRPGGVATGHDYFLGWKSVMKAVDKFFDRVPDVVYGDTSWVVRL